MREIHDHFFHKAKSEGFLARSAYKLIEIDDRKRLLRPGHWVLDCGAAPGSWMQVAAQRVAPQGVVVGFDLKSITHNFNTKSAHSFVADINTIDPRELLAIAHELAHPGQILPTHPRRFDVVLSDMAPNTSGDHSSDHHNSVRLCRAVLNLASQVLKPAGSLAMKVFEGEAYMDLVRDTAKLFTEAKGYKPTASRNESREMYIIATGFKPQNTAALDRNPNLPPPKPKPTPGWNKSPSPSGEGLG
ncbi:MAG TPA: RlmE family RNA methyltransferase [Phycisphaerales bacterium]|nr:RlmE family RNA methyltransferase [Phycisphaerales bacterium]